MLRLVLQVTHSLRRASGQPTTCWLHSRFAHSLQSQIRRPADHLPEYVVERPSHDHTLSINHLLLSSKNQQNLYYKNSAWELMAGMEFKSSEFAKQPPLFWKLKWAAGQGIRWMHPHDRTVDPARLSQADIRRHRGRSKEGGFIAKKSKDLMISNTFQWLGDPKISQVYPKCIYNLLMSRSACCPCCPCWFVIPGY